jgi:indole-3-glycerol phosphate synthase
MKPTILETIVANKRIEVEQKKTVLPESELMKQTRKRPYYSLKNNLLKDGSNGIIAEFKRKSPSKGWLFPDARVLDITLPYEKAGVCGLSILTDNEFFGGNDGDVIMAAQQVKTPILRKEFIIDPYQIYEADKMGADVILLIASVLTPDQVKHYASICKSVGLETLLEIHNEQELGHICPEITMVGVNNRNLHSFEVSLENSVRLSKQIPDGFVKIAESGIASLNDLIYLKNNGFHGFLMGEIFMKTGNPGETCQQFINDLKNKM